MGAGLCDGEGQLAHIIYDPTSFVTVQFRPWLDLACFLDLSSSDLNYEISLDLYSVDLGYGPFFR